MRVLGAHFHHQRFIHDTLRNEAMAHTLEQYDPQNWNEHIQQNEECVDDRKLFVLRLIAFDGRVLAEPRTFVIVVELKAVERLELLGGHWRHHEVRQ